MEYNYPTLYHNPNPAQLSLTRDPYSSIQSPNPNPSSYYGSALQLQQHDSATTSSSLYYHEPNLLQQHLAHESATTSPLYHHEPNLLHQHLAHESYRLSQVAGLSLNGAQNLTPTNLNSTTKFRRAKHVFWKPGQKKSNGKGTKLKGTMAKGTAWCEVCKLGFNSDTVLASHKLGKRHKKSLEKLNGGSVNAASTSAPLVASVSSVNTFIGPQERPAKLNSADEKDSVKKMKVVEDLLTKKQKVLEGGASSNEVRICNECNVVCNSDTVFRAHLTGKRHIAQTTKQEKPDKVNSTNGQYAVKKVKVVENLEAKRKKVLEGGAASNEVRVCHTCNVVCNSETVFNIHIASKKHIANLTKQEKSTTSSSLVPSAVSGNTIVGPQEKPDNMNIGNGLDALNKTAELVVNLETKRQKILLGGADTNMVRTCLACNVVCNSDDVFRFHLAGRKHIANMKKQPSGAGVLTPAT